MGSLTICRSPHVGSCSVRSVQRVEQRRVSCGRAASYSSSSATSFAQSHSATGDTTAALLELRPAQQARGWSMTAWAAALRARGRPRGSATHTRRWKCAGTASGARALSFVERKPLWWGRRATPHGLGRALLPCCSPCLVCPSNSHSWCAAAAFKHVAAPTASQAALQGDISAAPGALLRGSLCARVPGAKLPGPDAGTPAAMARKSRPAARGGGEVCAHARRGPARGPGAGAPVGRRAAHPPVWRRGRGRVRAHRPLAAGGHRGVPGGPPGGLCARRGDVTRVAGPGRAGGRSHEQQAAVCGGLAARLGPRGGERGAITHAARM